MTRLLYEQIFQNRPFFVSFEIYIDNTAQCLGSKIIPECIATVNGSTVNSSR